MRQSPVIGRRSLTPLSARLRFDDKVGAQLAPGVQVAVEQKRRQARAAAAAVVNASLPYAADVAL